MKLAILPVTPFQQNCSLVVCTTTNHAALVDPGGEVDRLLDAVAKSGATLEKILVTHGHVDHCGGVAELAQRTGVPIEGPQREDAFWIEQLARQAAMFGVPSARPFVPDRFRRRPASLRPPPAPASPGVLSRLAPEIVWVMPPRRCAARARCCRGICSCAIDFGRDFGENPSS